MSDLPVPVDAIPALSVGPFTATPIGLIVAGQDVPYEIWESYGGALCRVESAIQFVLGDWLNFGEAAYGEKYSQALTRWPEYKYNTLAIYASIADRVKFLIRIKNLDWSHHREVANLDPDEQRYWLERAAYEDDEPWSVRELRTAIREGKRGEIESLPLPPGLFEMIVIDPPWPYGTQYDPLGRRAASPYPEMNLEAIGNISLPAAPDCVLWLWTTHKFMRHSFEILDIWGFRDVAIVAWVKNRMGLGQWLRSQCEFCIMAVKGSPKVALSNQTTVIRGDVREHSRKPDEFYAMVDTLCQGRKLDWFSREKREGWEQYGDEPERFA